MNKKSVIGLLFVGALTFMTTSCADMFNIDSSRIVYEHNHKLDSSADSVYSTIGILHAFQQIADRYIILGEVRGDMVDLNKNAKASLRNLSEFNFDDDNEYLRVGDYYNVINNCNYLITHMDTTIRHNNKPVMTDEYVAASASVHGPTCSWPSTMARCLTSPTPSQRWLSPKQIIPCTTSRIWHLSSSRSCFLIWNTISLLGKVFPLAVHR